MGELIAFPQERPEDTEAEPLWREALGHELREERHRQERTLADVAEESGVSTQYLSEIERGRKEASSEILGALCRVLDLTEQQLLEDVAAEYAADYATQSRSVVSIDRGAQLLAA